MSYPYQYEDTLVRQDSSSFKCRFIPFRGSGLKKVKDGVEVDVKFTIAIPTGSPYLMIGEVISGIDPSGEYIVFEDTIASFHRGKYHSVAQV